MIVIDASTIVEVLLRTEAGRRIEARLFDANETLHVPHLIDIEVAYAIRRAWRMGLIEAARGEEALDDMAAWPLLRYPHDLFLLRIWQLRHNVTAYDAAYVALAEALESVLLTCDVRLASSSGHMAVIEVG